MGARAQPGQRERLIDAMITLCARVGYPQVTVAGVCAHAGVSTATLYEFFSDGEDLLLAACRTASRRILGQPPPASCPDGPDGLRGTLERVLGAWQTDPDAAHLLFVAALGGPSRAHRERERSLRAFERRMQAILDGGEDGQATLELPAPALTGALSAVASGGLAPGGALGSKALAGELLAWVSSYALPAGARRLGSASEMLVADASERPGGLLAGLCPAPAARIPRGRHRLPQSVVGHIHRSRIIHAVADVVCAKGYEQARVADIVTRAGIARGVFYEHFANKHDAFAAAQRYGSTEIRRVCSQAYFAHQDWPARVWAILSAATGLIASNPALAHLRLLDCYPAGAAAIERTEQLRAAAAIFIYEGFACSRSAAAPPDRSVDAITGALFELVRRDLAGGRAAVMLPRRVPQLAFIAIAPFTGSRAASAFVRERALACTGAHRASASG